MSKVLALFGSDGLTFTELLCCCTTSMKLFTFFFFEFLRSIFFKSFGRFFACGLWFSIFSVLLSYFVVTVSVLIMCKWLPLRLLVLFYKMSDISIFLVSTLMLLKFEPYLAEFSNWLGRKDLISLICEVIVSWFTSLAPNRYFTFLSYSACISPIYYCNLPIYFLNSSSLRFSYLACFTNSIFLV